jgi:hypothetical protein
MIKKGLNLKISLFSYSKRCLKVIITLFIASILPGTLSGQGSSVRIIMTDSSWKLEVNGDPFFIKGVVGFSYPEKINEYGGNSVRMGSRKSDLDNANDLGLKALVNLPAGAERDGMNYDDTVSVRNQTEKIVSIIRNLKDHPAVLMWAIGNELDFIPPTKPFNPKVWDAVNQAAKAIHAIDKNHPVMTVIGTSMMWKVADIVKRCPDLDLLGINSYGDIYTLGDTLRKYGWTKPYVITEWGPDGYWEVKKTPWGAPYEQTGLEKYNCYKNKYIDGILKNSNQCLGSYVFYWAGFKQETTHTWFCMFDKEGLESPLVGLMHSLWTGTRMQNEAPVADSIRIGQYNHYYPLVADKGTPLTATAYAKDPDGDKLTYKWEIRPEAVYASYAGQGEKIPEPVSGLIAGEGESITFTAPSQPGPYRLFAYVYDDNGHFSSVNLPFFVSSELKGKTGPAVLASDNWNKSQILAGKSHKKAKKTWDVFEISLQSSWSPENPYVSFIGQGKPAHLTAVFSGISGDCAGSIITVPGFWDGNENWKIRFAPPKAGKWKYETISPDKKMSRKRGEILVTGWSDGELKENPARRGFVFVKKDGPGAGRYFAYADGTPFLWIGDTWWDWTNRRIRFESFKKLADTRSEQGFNIGQLFFAGNGWGRESSLLDTSFTHPDIDQIRKVEKMISYANSKGITVWIHAWWSREGINKSIGEENIIRWWRYVVDRLQAYNVIWVLAGEYNMNSYGGFTQDFWNRLGEIIKSEDPYKRIISVHPTPPMWSGGAEAPQWSTAEAVQKQSWLDYNQSQTGHARWCNELTPEIVSRAYNMKPAKPIVVTEPWYEFIEGNPSAMDIRFGAWSAIMSGAAGHSYGGGHIWRVHLPERPTEVGSWPMDTDLNTNTMLYPGAVSVSFMGKYLRKIEWWKLEPHPELVQENPSHYCLAIPGKEYLFYLRYGGSVKLDLRSSDPSEEFNIEWTDLVNSSESAKGSIKGGSFVEITCPEDYPATVSFKDWLLHVKKTN